MPRRRWRAAVLPLAVVVALARGVRGQPWASGDDSAGAPPPQPVVLLPPLQQLSLAPVGGEHVYVIPATPECEDAAERVCTAVVRRCRPVEGCEVQCRAPSVPPLSPQCIASHPCAPDVETLCADTPPGGIMRCLHGARAALSPACRAAEPCLAAPNWREECGLPHGHAHRHDADGGVVGIKRFMHGLFPFVHNDWERGDCACLDTCAEHLTDAVCQPCDPAAVSQAPPRRGAVAFVRGKVAGSGGGGGGGGGGGDGGDGASPGAPTTACVLNPACGLGRRWCRVAPACTAPFVHVVDVRGCNGPYPQHASCEAAIMHGMAAGVPPPPPAPLPPGAAGNASAAAAAHKADALAHIQAALHRCAVQTEAAASGACPPPTAAEVDAAHSYVDAASLTRVRSCFAPPSLGSFVRHFMDRVAGVLHNDGAAPPSATSGGATMAFRAGRAVDPRAPPQVQVHVAQGAAAAPPPHASWHSRLATSLRSLLKVHAPPSHAAQHSGAWTAALVVMGVGMLVVTCLTVLWVLARHRVPLLPRRIAACGERCWRAAGAAVTLCGSWRGRRFPYPLSAMFGAASPPPPPPTTSTASRWRSPMYADVDDDDDDDGSGSGGGGGGSGMGVGVGVGVGVDVSMPAAAATASGSGSGRHYVVAAGAGRRPAPTAHSAAHSASL